MTRMIPVLIIALCALTLTVEAATKKEVTFMSHGASLAGDLYLPSDFKPGTRLPAAVVAGSWTSVKEQMAGAYAAKLADKGYAALAFDFRGWGKSKGTPRYLEDPQRKTADIVAAAEYLASRPEVRADQVGGVGICASAGYMSGAALASPNIKTITLIAPWLHDREIAEAAYGGKEGVANLIQLGRNAHKADAPVVIEAASGTNDKALMYQTPYYTESDRGLIPEYDNKFNVASWEPWLTYDAIETGSKLKKRVLLIHSESAAIPQGARKFAEKMGRWAATIWLENVTQLDFYDRPEPMQAAVDATVDHFDHNLIAGNTARSKPSSQAAGQASIPATPDVAAITTIIESVAVLADRGNFEALEGLYADPVRVDHTALSGGEPESKSPRELMTSWASTLPGFARTRNNISNVAVDVTGDTADATADVIASHWVDDLFWEVTGTHRYTLKKTDAGWQITSDTFVPTKERGTRDVFGPAGERAAANPVSYILRQQTEQAVRDLLGSLEKKDMDRFANVWAEDAVLHMPYSPEGFPKRVSERENLIAHYAGWPENSGDADFTSQLTFYPMQDPEWVFATFVGKADIVPTGRVYNQNYGALVHVVDGKVKLFREYYDPAVFIYAYGLDEGGSFN